MTTDEETAWGILDACPVVHLAWTDADGRPDVRALHGARVGRWLYLHGAPVGAKTGALDRPVTVVAHEEVASIPSHFLDPERACPATTWYRSVRLTGILRLDQDPDRRAAALEALMQALQPEGGYVPLRADDPRYRATLAKMLVAYVEPEGISGRLKMGQHRPAQVPLVLAGLWRRGEPGDLRAFERIRALSPHAALPTRLTHPAVTLHVHPSETDRETAIGMLTGAYWNTHLSPAVVASGWQGAPVWIGARDVDGHLIATASAMSDTRRGWISDVIVDPAWRGRGIGRAVMHALLDHPAMRRCVAIGLRTRDAQPFYAELGFSADRPKRPFPIDEMWLNRSA